MKYNDFKALVKQYPVFRSTTVLQMCPKPSSVKVQLGLWVKKGLLIQLKRGLYTLADEERVVGVSSYLIANTLYAPSYISLESALAFYGFIPERVHLVTSVTSKTTRRFHTKLGSYAYAHIKLPMFTGFVATKDPNGNTVYIATPEKAVIDFLYYKLRQIKKFDLDLFDKSFRFQNMDSVNPDELVEFANLSSNKRLMHAVNLLKQWLENTYD